jgi:hypothetical protein
MKATNKPLANPQPCRRLLLSALACLCAGAAIAQPTISTNFALPSSAGDTTKPGFVWRIHQVSTNVPNSNLRTEQQLAGAMGDNIADPNAQGPALAPAAPAGPSTAPLTFEIPGTINMTIGYGGFDTGDFFSDTPFPGLVGLTGGYENAAGELLAWLDLPAGTNTMGVNSDDGFRIMIGGANPGDRSAVMVRQYDGGRASADTIFDFVITKTGLYAVRCTWENGCCGAALELFTVKSDGTKVLVNDTANGGLRAYRAVTTAPRAYARKVVPTPGTGTTPSTPFIVELVDGAKAVSANSIKVAIDGTQVTTVRSKTGNVTTTTYTRPSFYSPGPHAVAFTYTEGNTVVTLNWTFTTMDYQGPSGNFYEFVSAPNISWPEAKAAAEQRTLGCGTHGHLVTITSADEDVFIEFLRQEYVQGSALSGGEVWAGGYQLPNQANPGDGWFWVNNEGPIPAFNWTGPYANWDQSSSEPNDCCNTSGFEDNEEQYLGLGYFGNGAGWIDDDVSHRNIVGYVVEYEAQPIIVDIKPGTNPNQISLSTFLPVPVAILSSASFDASTVDPSTVTFGRNGIEATPLTTSLTDVNKDGRKDLVCYFNGQDTGLLCGDTSASLRALTKSGCPLRGSDSIQTIQCPPYALTVLPLIDIQQVTDVYLTTSVLIAGHQPPLSAPLAVLTSRSIRGKLSWIKAETNVSLALNPDYTSTGDLRYSNLIHGQKLDAVLTVKDIPSGSLQVLFRTGAHVLYRPDLAIGGVVAPAQANVHQTVNITASLKELKGDLGATANVLLLDGNTQIDAIYGVSVPKLGDLGGSFAAKFTSPGVHHLKIAVRDVNPGDFDPSNNEVAFDINIVVPPLVAVYYNAYYNYYDQDYQVLEESPYWLNSSSQQYTNEYFYETLYIPASLQFPLSRVTLSVTVDGINRKNVDISNIAADSSYYDGCTTSFYDSRDLGDDVFLYVQTYQDCYGGQQTYASFSRSEYTQIYYSTNFDKVWGTGSESSGSYSYGSGIYWNAQSSIATRFVVESGAAFGGNGLINLYSYPYNDTFDYYNYDYQDGLYDDHVTGHSAGSSSYGSVYDLTTP